MKKGFTLIDFLVIVAILAMLAAVLLPVAFRMREYSHIEQILAGTREVQDCDRRFVIGWHENDLVSKNMDRLSSIMNLKTPEEGVFVSRSISVILRGGRTMTTSVMIPRGSEIESVSVQPAPAEAPPRR